MFWVRRVACRTNPTRTFRTRVPVTTHDQKRFQKSDNLTLKTVKDIFHCKPSKLPRTVAVQTILADRRPQHISDESFPSSAPVPSAISRVEKSQNQESNSATDCKNKRTMSLAAKSRFIITQIFTVETKIWDSGFDIRA